MRNLFIKCLFLSTLVIAFDQITKFIAETSLNEFQRVAILPSFNLTLLYNEGAAFSFLSDAGEWKKWFFITLSSGVSLYLIYWLKKIERHQVILATGIALILGGAVGNLVDRVLYGHVIDFIQLYYSTFYWPAFNIADSAITAGIGLLLLDMVRELSRDKKHG